MTSYVPEPKIRDSLRFAGEPKFLRQFLLDIYNVLDRFADSFTYDKRRINWVAAHFGRTTPSKAPTSSQSWFLALLEQNALLLGVADPYANLKGMDYVEPELVSFSAFIAELINVFGDWMSAKSAREALEDCVQGDTTVVDYNAKFTSLSHQVLQSAEDAMLRYANGLNRDVYLECSRIPGWISAPTLAIKQLLTIEAAKVVEALASAPSGKRSKGNTYSHPNSHAHLPLSKPTPIPIIRQPASPTPMDVSAITKAQEDRRVSPVQAIRSACIQQGLCFKCIKPYDSTHTANGQRKCPNSNASFTDKLKLLKTTSKPKTHQIATVEEENAVQDLDEEAWRALDDEESEQVQELVGEYLEGWSSI